MVRADEDPRRAGLAQFVAVLAGLVGVEAVVRALDQADAQSALAQHRYQLQQQCRLAGAADCRETEDGASLRRRERCPGRIGPGIRHRRILDSSIVHGELARNRDSGDRGPRGHYGSPTGVKPWRANDLLRRKRNDEQRKSLRCRACAIEHRQSHSSRRRRAAPGTASSRRARHLADRLDRVRAVGEEDVRLAVRDQHARRSNDPPAAAAIRARRSASAPCDRAPRRRRDAACPPSRTAAMCSRPRDRPWASRCRASRADPACGRATCPA